LEFNKFRNSVNFINIQFHVKERKKKCRMLYTTPTGDSTPVGLSGTIPAGISNLINVQYL